MAEVHAAYMNISQPELRKRLAELKLPHYICEGDGWFSCPMSEEGCLNFRDKGCTCGAEAHNAKIDALIMLI